LTETCWVIIDKPAGWTSTAVVNKVKWAFQAQKAGHAGTLDPAATGVLAVALGEATKTVPFITDALKAYEFMVKFGEATNTDDAEGEVISRSESFQRLKLMANGPMHWPARARMSRSLRVRFMWTV